MKKKKKTLKQHKQSVGFLHSRLLNILSLEINKFLFHTILKENLSIKINRIKKKVFGCFCFSVLVLFFLFVFLCLFFIPASFFLEAMLATLFFFFLFFCFFFSPLCSFSSLFHFLLFLVLWTFISRHFDAACSTRNKQSSFFN